MLDEETVREVLGRCAANRHPDVGKRHVALLYPPGPDGATPEELGARARLDVATVMRLLDELGDLGYLERERSGAGEERVWLTVEGHDLVAQVEAVVLASARERAYAT
jgi:DNA-binding MarR family transcriptional regulator